MNINKMKLWHKKKKIGVTALIVALLSLVVWGVFAQADGLDENILGRSSTLGNSANTLSARNIQLTNIGDGVVVVESGSITGGDLKLVLSVPDKFEKIIMYRSDGTTVSKTKTDAITTFSLSEEYIPEISTQIATDDEYNDDISVDNLIDTSSALSLGHSEPTLGQSGATAFGSPYGSSYILEFDANSEGTYSFETYDSIDPTAMRLRTLGYWVGYGTNDEALNLRLINSSQVDTPFTMQQGVFLKVQYNPMAGHAAEKLTITLPPDFELLTTPSTIPARNVVVTKVDAPAKFYDDSFSTILKQEWAGKKKVTQITMEFSETEVTAKSFDLSIYYNSGRVAGNSSENQVDLGNLMIKYGATPDQIPFRIIGDLENLVGGEIVSQNVIYGTSAITNADGSVVTHGSKPTYTPESRTISREIGSHVSTAGANFALSIGAWHYPLSDAYGYIPKTTENALLLENTAANVSETTISGKTFWKVKIENMVVLKSFERRFVSTKVRFDIVTAVLPGDTFEVGQTYLEYTYMGSPTGLLEAVNYTGQIVVPDKWAGFMTRNYRHPDTGGMNLGGRYQYKEQGTGVAGERNYRFWFDNRAHLNNGNWNLGAVYENAKMVFETPYEVSTLSINTTGRFNRAATVEYYTYGDPNPKSGGTLYLGGSQLNLPVTKDDHVVKVVVNMGDYVPWYDTVFEFSAYHHDKHADGSILPIEYPTMDVKGYITTRPSDPTAPANSSTYGFDLPESQRQYYIFGDAANGANRLSYNDEMILFKRQAADSLHFGTLAGYSNFRDGIYLTNPGSLYYETPNDSRAPKFALKNEDPLMKDYENVSFDMYPKDAASAKGFSMVTGVRVGGFTVGTTVEKVEVYYDTNFETGRKVEGGDIVSEGSGFIFHKFDLAHGEYPKAINIKVGKIFGEKLTYFRGPDTGDKPDANGYKTVNIIDNARNTNVFTLPIRTSRFYFQDSPEEEQITENGNSYFVAEMHTDTVAQYINGLDNTANAKTSNKAVVSATFFPYGTAGLKREGHSWDILDKNNQGGIKTVYNQSEFLSFKYTRLGYGPNGDYKYPVDTYIEVHKDFELVSLVGYKIVGKKSIDTNYDLYHLQADLVPNGTRLDIVRNGVLYIKPNAALGTVVALKNAGDSHKHYEDTYLDKGLENSPPYNKLSYSGAVAFPALWNGGDWEPVMGGPVYYSTKATSITIVEKIEHGLHLSVGKGSSSAPVEYGKFQDFEKQNMEILGEIANANDPVIGYYKAYLTIPEINTNTPSLDADGNHNTESNEFTLKVRDLVYVDSSIPNDPVVAAAEIVYYSDIASTQVVDIEANPGLIGTVKSVSVLLKNIPGKSKYMIRVPVKTDHEKIKDNTDIINTYVGAYVQAGEASPRVQQKALVYGFYSYELNLRAMLDATEEGKTVSNLSQTNVVKFTVTYKDSTSPTGETELYSNAVGVGNSHTLNINADAAKVYVEVLDSRFLLTVQNKALNESFSSDYPRGNKINAQLDIDANDLQFNGGNKYDVGVIMVPNVSVVNISTQVNQTKRQAPVIGTKINLNTAPSVYVAHYTDEMFDIVGGDKADLSFYKNPSNNTRLVEAYGKKKGAATYKYRLTNRLGDIFEFGPFNVNVTAGMVPVQSLTKSLATGSVLIDPLDKFPFKIWIEGEPEPTNPSINVSTNVVTTLNKIELAEKMYIKEDAINLPKGYELESFSGKIYDKNGVESAIDFTNEGGGVSSFTTQIDTSKVELFYINKNQTINLMLRKKIAIDSHEVDPAEKFNIVVTDTTDNQEIGTYDLEKDETDNITLSYGKTYELVENLPANSKYKSSVKVVTADGTTLVGDFGSSDNNTYSIKVGRLFNENNIILVTNAYPEGEGLELTKATDFTSALATGETFEFTLSGENNFTAYGKISASNYPAGVSWYKSSAPGAQTVSLSKLPVGSYTLKEETSGNVNFQFVDFTGNVTHSSGTNEATFTVTESSAKFEAVVNNRVKTIGSVTVNKTVPSSAIRDFPDAQIVFSLTHTDTGRVYTSTRKVSDNVAGSGIVFTEWLLAGTNMQGKLPLGEYTLKESTNTIFDFDGFTSVPTGATVTGDTVKFTLLGSGSDRETFAVGAKNALKKSSVKINKTIVGDLTGITEDFEFDLYQSIDDSVSNDIKVAGSPFKIQVDTATTNIGSVTVPNLVYGSYYVRELDRSEYALDSSSEVIGDDGSTPAAVKIKLLNSTAAIEFAAINELRKSSKELAVYKRVLDDDASLAATEFKLVLKWMGTPIYEGKVSSKDSSAATALGKKILWTKIGTHQNGVVTGGALKNLYYGAYTLEEEIPANSEFMLKDITHTAGLGTISVSNKKISFTINETSEGLTDYTVTFQNQYRMVKDAKVAKTFDSGTNSSNIRQIDFGFEYRVGTDDTTKQTVSSVNENTTGALVLERGQTYQIKEDSVTGYSLDSFAITTNSAETVSITDQGSGWWQFKVPVDASELKITATNISHGVSMTLDKEVSGINLLPTTNFGVKIVETARPTVAIWEKTDIAAGNTGIAIPNLVNGIDYTVTETTGSLYKLDSMTVLKGGGAVSEADVQGNGNVYSFKKTAESDNATMKLTNLMVTGKGVSLEKHIPQGSFNSLGSENFTFKLSGPHGYELFGTAAKSASSNNVTVAWKNAADTAVAVAELPIGSYSITETGNNINYEFDKFISGSQTVVANKFDFAVDTTTANVLSVEAHNKPKQSGRVELKKTFTPLSFVSDTFDFELKYLDSTPNKVYTVSKGSAGTNGAITITDWSGGVGAPITTLPVGKYAITESSAGLNYNWDGFEASDVAGNQGSDMVLSGANKTATFTLSNDTAQNKINSVSLNGKNSLKTGSVKITKSLSGGVAINLPAVFKFELYKQQTDGSYLQIDQAGLPSTDTIDITINTASDVKNVTIPNLPFGQYYVMEQVHEHYLLTSLSDVMEKGTIVDPQKVLKMKHDSVDIEFRAYNKSRTADNALTIDKRISSLVLGEQSTFKVQLFYPSYSTTNPIYDGELTTDASGNLTTTAFAWRELASGQGMGSLVGTTAIKDLPHGKYIFKEVDTGVSYDFDKIVSGGSIGAISGANGWEFVIGRSNTDADLSFEIHNKPKEIGKVDISKEIIGGNPLPNTEFTFKLVNVNGTAQYTTKIKAGESVTTWTRLGDNAQIANGTLPYGVYDITEELSPNFTLDTFKDVTPAAAGTATATKATVTVNGTHQTIKVTAINKVKTSGTIKADKAFENNYNHKADTNSFTLLLFGPEINGVMPSTPEIITVNKSVNWAKVLTGRSYGNYRIQEDLPANQEFEFVSMTHGITTVTANTGITFMLGEDIGENKQADIKTMNRVASTGKLTIRKEIQGDNGSPNAEFLFTITDALGNVEKLTLKANEEKILSNLLYGNVTVTEEIVEDYNHMGGEVNGGGVVGATSFNVPVMDSGAMNTLTTFSKNKTDGTLTIEAAVTEDLENVRPGENFYFTLYRSLDDGITWAPVTSAGKTKAAPESVKLQIGEKHTFTDLLRGGKYRISASIDPVEVYQVRDMIVDADATGTVDLKAGIFTFVPSRDKLANSVKYLLDIKRIDIVLHKYELFHNGPIPKARFSLYRLTGVDKNITEVYYGGGRTDELGNLELKGLSAGRYKLEEKYAPKGFKKLESIIYLEITNNNQTGELDLAVKDSRYTVYDAQNKVLLVPNDQIFDDGSNDGSSIPDVSNPFPQQKAVKEVPIPGEKPILGLPVAGGTPVSYIGFVGFGISLIGALILRKDKKNGKNSEDKEKSE